MSGKPRPAASGASSRGSPPKGAGGKRKDESQKLRTKDGYLEYRQAMDAPMGAPPPAGLSYDMSLTGASDMKTAFDMLDERKEGALDRVQSRKWLRCAGWCVKDEVLDQMLNTVDQGRGKTRGGIPAERTKWGLRQLSEIAENCRDRDNSSLEEVRNALRRLAGNKSRIQRERLLEFTVQEKGLKNEDLEEVLDILGMGSSKLIDCDGLAEKLLYRICNPPSVFEQQTY
mmetsp:Transcript_114998/g.199446  ORF Transcript_114998/g.199446 Transcript_114998/m.199446 type:complete len:229 (-) Transcript_114998:70-756(-)